LGSCYLMKKATSRVYALDKSTTLIYKENSKAN